MAAADFYLVLDFCPLLVHVFFTKVEVRSDVNLTSRAPVRIMAGSLVNAKRHSLAAPVRQVVRYGFLGLCRY